MKNMKEELWEEPLDRGWWQIRDQLRYSAYWQTRLDIRGPVFVQVYWPVSDQVSDQINEQFDEVNT